MGNRVREASTNPSQGLRMMGSLGDGRAQAGLTEWAF